MLYAYVNACNYVFVVLYLSMMFLHFLSYKSLYQSTNMIDFVTFWESRVVCC
jgi:hypothetical protein